MGTLLLEFVPSGTYWPWYDLDAATEVLRRLAHVHQSSAPVALIEDWNYDEELAAQASNLLWFLERNARGDSAFRYATRMRSTIRRITEQLTARPQRRAGAATKRPHLRILRRADACWKR